MHTHTIKKKRREGEKVSRGRKEGKK